MSTATWDGPQYLPPRPVRRDHGYPSAMTFVPFDVTDEESQAWTVLRTGVPKSMRPSLVTWIFIHKTTSRFLNVEVLRRFSNALDIDFGLNDSFTGLLSEEEFRNVMSGVSDRSLLHIVDLCLSEFGGTSSGPPSLTKILNEGRSAYNVVRQEDRRHRLAVRVPEGVQDAAEALSADGSTAGNLLRKAWNSVYDLTPHDSAAYFYAVRSVESAAFRTLDITSPTATLGNAIRAIESKDASWRLPFLREHTQYPSKDLLLGMLKSMYRGQRDRHGSIDDYSDVTHEEAEGAVLLAVTLVGWFSRGLVVERDTEIYG